MTEAGLSPDPSRRRAALAFAAVGLVAAAAHALASDAGSLRLWRETLPLAGLVGAAAGAILRPSGWSAGALVSLLAVFAFALAYGVAETAIAAGRGDIAGPGGWVESLVRWTADVVAKAGVGGTVAILAGGAAGHWLGRLAKR